MSVIELLALLVSLGVAWCAAAFTYMASAIATELRRERYTEPREASRQHPAPLDAAGTGQPAGQEVPAWLRKPRPTCRPCAALRRILGLSQAAPVAASTAATKSEPRREPLV